MGRLPRAIDDGLIHQNQNFPVVYPAPLACATLRCPPVLPRLKVIDAETPERLRTFIHPPPVHIQHAMALETCSTLPLHQHWSVRK